MTAQAAAEASAQEALQGKAAAEAAAPEPASAADASGLQEEV